MPIPLEIINSFNVIFSVLVFPSSLFSSLFFITAFYRSSPHCRYISGDVPFLSLLPV